MKSSENEAYWFSPEREVDLTTRPSKFGDAADRRFRMQELSGSNHRPDGEGPKIRGERRIEQMEMTPYNFTIRGPVAQLGERLNGIQEVGGSSPPRSTFYLALSAHGRTTSPPRSDPS